MLLVTRYPTVKRCPVEPRALPPNLQTLDSTDMPLVTKAPATRPNHVHLWSAAAIASQRTSLETKTSATGATVASLDRARWPSMTLVRRPDRWQHSWQHPPHPAPPICPEQSPIAAPTPNPIYPGGIKPRLGAREKSFTRKRATSSTRCSKTWPTACASAYGHLISSTA
jgi:hypothetical protein